MSKPIGPKEAAARAMREAQFAARKAPRTPPDDLKAAIAAVPVKRVPKKKRL